MLRFCSRDRVAFGMFLVIPALWAGVAWAGVACSGSTAGTGGGGHGGAGGDWGAIVSAVSSTSAKATSSSTGPGDAGDDWEGGCATCTQILYGIPDHETALQHLCAGSEAQTSWASLISCACAMGGSCFTDCTGTAFCDAVFKNGWIWADPVGTCKNCFEADSGTGCGPFRLQCTKT